MTLFDVFQARAGSTLFSIFPLFFIFPVCRPTAPDGAKITMTKRAIDLIFPLCRLRGGKMLFLFKITKINFSAFLCVSGLMPFSNVVDWISSVCLFSLLFLLNYSDYFCNFPPECCCIITIDSGCMLRLRWNVSFFVLRR